MVAWRFAIRVRLEYRGEHDQDEDQPLGRGNRPSDGPSEADTHVCGSFGGFSRRRANAHRSGAGQRRFLEDALHWIGEHSQSGALVEHGHAERMLVAAAIFAASAGTDMTWRPLALLGDASYAIYLTHTLTMGAFRHSSMPAWKESLWSALLILIIATVVGILVHLYIETPILSWIRKRSWTHWKPEKAAEFVRAESESAPVT